MCACCGMMSEMKFERKEASRAQWLNLGITQSNPSDENQMKKKSRRGPRSRSSEYRGVTFYRRTARWESHIWDSGKQVYLGGFDTAHAAARAYDRAAIKFRGVDADINFNVNDYHQDLEQMRNLNKHEFVQILRRQTTGFSRGTRTRTCPPLTPIGHNKAYYESEAVTSYELSNNNYQPQIILESNATQGNDHNLDLNLGISLPSHGQNTNNHTAPSHQLVQNRSVEGEQSSPGIINFMSKHEEKERKGNEKWAASSRFSSNHLNLQFRIHTTL